MFRFLIGLLCVTGSLGTSVEFPLRDLAVDQALLLDDWRFKAEPAESEVDWSAPDFAEERAQWKKITVPGIWDQAPGEVTLPVPVQAAWYRTKLSTPSLQTGQELALCFLGVKYTADVFVNGEYLGVHRGGYTPFLFTLPEALADASELEVVVRVENRLRNTTVPKQKAGWELYGGIDREVFLLLRPKTRPENIFVIPHQDEFNGWHLKMQADVLGEPEGPLQIRLQDDGQTLLSENVTDWDKGIDRYFQIHDALPWTPENPHLYQLELRWGDHHVRFPVGFREFHWRDGKLYLGQSETDHVWLQGFGQHEFYPKAGSILTPEQRRRDLRMMKDLYSANALRTGHYPHHPDLFNLADEIGLLLFTEIPVWQNNPNSLLEPKVWRHWIEPQLSEMILRHRNHPSVFGWGVLNEIGGAHPYILKARERIRSLDPTRGVAAVIASNHDFGINALTDFAARNLHYGWYHSRSVYALRPGLAENLKRASGLPVWVAELGGQARPGKLGGGFSDKVRGTETYQDKMTRFGLQYVMSKADEGVAGISLWTWSDYERFGHPHYHGILSGDRQPKLAAYTAMNLMQPSTVALGTEQRAVVPAGETFEAELSVFSRVPEAGRALNLIWQIRSLGQVLKEGVRKIETDPTRVTEAGKVSWSIPVDQAPALHFLYLELRDRQGLLHTQAIPFEAGGTTRPGILRLPLSATDTQQRVTLNGMTFTVYPHTGLLLPLPPGEVEVKRGAESKTVRIREAAVTELRWDD